MTPEDIIRMVREADLTYIPQAGWVVGSTASLDRFAHLVAAHERAQCEAVCEQVASESAAWWRETENPHDLGREMGASKCAVAIRVRGGA